MIETVWYNTKHDFLGVLSADDFFVGYYIDDDFFHYTVTRDAPALIDLGWQYVGLL